MSETSFRIAIVLIFLFWLYSLLMWNAEINKKIQLEQEKILLNKKVDSLENEIYVLDLKLFRHERAYEIFEKKYPEASSQLSDIISDETE